MPHHLFILIGIPTSFKVSETDSFSFGEKSFKANERRFRNSSGPVQFEAVAGGKDNSFFQISPEKEFLEEFRNVGLAHREPFPNGERGVAMINAYSEKGHYLLMILYHTIRAKNNHDV